MRYLGIDYGTKRIGMAISDEGGMLAFPLSVLSNDENIFSSIEAILKKEGISEIVVGESADLKGEMNRVQEQIEIFVEELKKFKIPVHKQKEFLTSVEARRYLEPLHADAAAAALILQRFLDRKNNGGASRDVI